MCYFFLEKEFRVTGRITADGYDSTTSTVYMVDGCFWHSHDCQNKHGNSRHAVRKPFTHREINELDNDRNRAILDAGYKLNIIRECQINSELKHNLFLKVCIIVVMVIQYIVAYVLLF